MKKTLIASLALVIVFSALPFFAYATSPTNYPDTGSGNLSNTPDTGSGNLSNTPATTCSVGSYSDIISCALDLINSLIPVIVALIVIWIVWSAFNFARAGDEERNKHRDAMVWGNRRAFRNSFDIRSCRHFERHVRHESKCSDQGAWRNEYLHSSA